MYHRRGNRKRAPRSPDLASESSLGVLLGNRRSCVVAASFLMHELTTWYNMMIFTIRSVPGNMEAGTFVDIPPLLCRGFGQLWTKMHWSGNWRLTNGMALGIHGLVSSLNSNSIFFEKPFFRL